MIRKLRRKTHSGDNAGLNVPACFQVQVVAEALNNLVHHRLAGRGPGLIQIRCHIIDNDLEIIIGDQRLPFD